MVVLQNISVSLKKNVDQYLSQRMFVCMYDVYNHCCPRDTHIHTHRTATTTDVEVESL